MRSAAKLEIVRGLVPATPTFSHERTLPVVDGLTSVVPSGCLQRGTTVAVHGVGATSFALAIAGQPVRDGSFLAIVAPASFGLAACLDFDIPLRRVVQFVMPAETDAAKWAQAVAAIVEGFDVVVLADQRRVGASQARQLVARNRERGSVLVRVGGPAWPEAADLRFDVNSPKWAGLGQGHGHLQDRRVSVQVAGRRHHGMGRSHEVMLPAAVDSGIKGGSGLVPAATALPVNTVLSGVERFAGSDVDAMLDAVEGRSVEGRGPEGSAAESDTAEAAAVDLDATA